MQQGRGAFGLIGELGPLATWLLRLNDV